MGSKGGGGGYDTSGMEAAARESNALQKQIYEESIERGQPWYQAGTAGLGTLLDYMGLAGGESSQSRTQIRDELAPSYTTAGGAGGTYTRDGQDYTIGQLVARHPAERRWTDPIQGQQWSQDPVGEALASKTGDDLNAYLATQGYDYTPAQTVDGDALNAAVQERLDQQAAAGTPDYYGSLLTPFGMEQFETDPSYQFRQDEGSKALERRLAAQGKTFSPEAAKALQEYNQNLASQEYGAAYGRYSADQANIYNRLANIAGMGQQQTSQMAGLGEQYGSSVAQTNASLASAQAQAQQAAQASKGSMFGNLMDMGGLGLAAYTAFSDERLKRDIKPVGQRNGFNLYEFKYNWSPKKYVGVMAQEVQRVVPEAVSTVNGWLAVDYSKLGFEMEAV